MKEIADFPLITTHHSYINIYIYAVIPTDIVYSNRYKTEHATTEITTITTQIPTYPTHSSNFTILLIHLDYTYNHGLQ